MMYLGLMSGTSLDGLDIALWSPDTPQNASGFQTYEFPDTLRIQLSRITSSANSFSLAEISSIEQEFDRFCAKCISSFLNEHSLTPADIIAIGQHGHTIYHAPHQGITWQISNGARLAALTQIDVVCDFRSADIALGGQGAPLAPLFHHKLLELQPHQAVLNIGGIANISLPNITGFDTGPGNTLMNQLAEKHFNLAYDKNANIAQKGQVDDTWLRKALNECYFSQKPPKSTGRELFNLIEFDFVGLKPEDAMRTALELTVESIAYNIEKFASYTQELLICGGGVHNPLMMQRLNERLASIQVTTLKQADALEAMGFAWLAHQHINKNPCQLKQLTGASKNSILGAHYQAPN